MSQEDQSKSRLFVVAEGTLKIVDQQTHTTELVMRAPGSIVDKKYRIIELIGEGGMGAVYQAHHLMLDKDVALKTFRSANLSDQALLRFQREAQAIGKINQAHVVQIFDFGLSEEGLPYYTMELLSGQSLADKIDRSGPLPTAAVLSLFRQICQGLAAAHSKGIIHRDLKPANIFIESGASTNNSASSNNVKIVDFGIASLSDLHGDQRLTTSGAVFGSPLYMSPEQSMGEAVTAQSDIYSLGCTIFEALRGVPPFRGASAVETIMLHHNQTSPSLCDATAGKYFPEDLESLISKMMAKSPEQRPKDIQTVEAALADIAENEALDPKVLRREQRSGAGKAARERDSTLAGSVLNDNPQKRLQRSRMLALYVIPATALLLFGIVLLFALQTGKKMPLNKPAAETRSGADITAIDVPSAADSTKPYSEIIIVNGSKWVVLHMRPDLYIGQICLNVDTEVWEKNNTGTIRWPLHGLVSLRPSREFAADSGNFEIIPDNSLFGIDLSDCDDKADVKKTIAMIMRQKDSVQSLVMAALPMQKDDFKQLMQLKHITNCSLSDSVVDGKLFCQIPNLKRYIGAGFAGGTNSRFVIQTLKDAANLKVLWMANSGLQAEDFKTIGTMKRLSFIDLASNNLKDEDLKCLLNLKRLGKLRIDGCKITAAALPTLQRLKDQGMYDLVFFPRDWSVQDAEKLQKIFPQAKKSGDPLPMIEMRDMYTRAQ